ncbi:MAG: hypothetical protein U1E99_10670 [Agitococcus sp.]
MTRKEMISKLEQAAPIVTQITGTMDMGFEFSAVVPNGVIYAEPGMLLSYSGGQWPPFQCEDTEGKEYEKLLREFLLDEEWMVTKWEDLSDEELEQLLEDVDNAQSSDEED